MRKHGAVLHLLITAAFGVLFFAVGELLFPFLTKTLPAPLGIAVYFALFGSLMLGVMYRLCKARGDYRGWQKKHLGEVVTASYRRAAIALAVLALAAGLFEFLYELEKIDRTEASSYIFLIDDSGSMAANDPQAQRATAIGTIMEKEDAQFPFAVYRFMGETERVRDMAPYRQGETFAFSPEGGTDIVGALRFVAEEVRGGQIAAGNAPKVLLLSDGESDSAGLDEVIRACRDCHIVVSTISFGMESDMLREIAGKTGGVYAKVSDANRLQQEMETAVTSSLDHNLLSARFVYGHDAWYAVLRILFLLLLGLVFSWMKQKCYCSAYDHGFADKVFILSLILCALAAVLTEVLFRATAVPGMLIRLIFCVLFAATPGVFWAEAAGGDAAVMGDAVSARDAFSPYGKRF